MPLEQGLIVWCFSVWQNVRRSDVLRRSAAVFDVVLVYTVCVNDDMSAHT